MLALQTLVITDPFILQQVMELERAGAIEKPKVGFFKNKQVGLTTPSYLSTNFKMCSRL